MSGVTSVFDNYAAELDILPCDDLEMKENVVRYVSNHKFPVCENEQIMDFNLSVDCCCKYVCMDDARALNNVLREYPHFATVKPPHFLASREYSLITVNKKNVCVGRGAESTCFLAKNNKSNELVVIKLITTTFWDVKRMLDECAMQTLASITLKDGCRAPEVKGFMVLEKNSKLRELCFPYLIVQEFCGILPGSTSSLSIRTALEEQIKGNPVLSERQWEDVSLQLLRGADQLAQVPIHHLDIKHENLLLQMVGDEINVVFIDFGLSIGTWSSENGTIFPLNPGMDPSMYPQIAPELFQLSRPLSTSDLFSCAFVIENIANINGNAELAQAMVEYRSMHPAERPGFLYVYYKVDDHCLYFHC